MDKYGKRKNAVEGKGLRVNVDKTKGMPLLFGKKSSVSKVDPCGVCGERLVVILLSVRNVTGGFIVHHQVFFSRTCLGHNCSLEEKLEFKRGEDVLEVEEKFCYQGDISCYSGASEEVSARIGSACREAGFIFETTGEG